MPDEERKDGRLRVLLISHYYWPEPFRINQVAEDLIAAGADVVVLTGHPSYPGGKVFGGYRAHRLQHERHPKGYSIYRVPVVPRGNGRALRLFLNYMSFVVTGIVFGAWLLRGQRFDVLFNYTTTPVFQGFVGVWFRLLKRAPLVLWIQDIWPQALQATGFVKSPTILATVGWITRRLYRQSNLILCQSRAFVTMLRPEAGRTPLRFFPNPGEHPPAAVAAQAPVLPANKFNVVFGGNLGTLQAMETVVAAARLLRDDPDVRITLFGSGAMQDWIAAQIAEYDIANLSLAGRLPPEVMPQVYSQCQALLLTLVDSPDLAQTVPSKFQSYLAAGVPLLVAVNGEAAELVAEAGAGVAVAAEDAVALADAIRELKGRPAKQRAAMGRAARRYYEENYRPEQLAAKLLVLLQGAAACGWRPGDRRVGKGDAQ